MANKIYISFFILFFFTSCSKNAVYNEHHEFENNTWAKSEIIDFDVNIEDVNSDYDILVAIRHISGYPFANVVVGLTIETPAGETRMMQHSLIIRNTDGSFKGDGLGDIWDIEVPVFEKYQFKEKGIYKFTFENRMHLAEMPGLMSIGLILKKTKARTDEV